MESSQLYEKDIYAWSAQQAEALRHLATLGRRLPNELDLEHIAEEIEDRGKSERHAAESALRLILVHLIKLVAAPDAPPARHWRSEIVGFHIELGSHLTPSMAGRIDLNRIWTQAKRQARANLHADEIETGGGALWSLIDCPFRIPRFTEAELDVGAMVHELRGKA